MFYFLTLLSKLLLQGHLELGHINFLVHLTRLLFLFIVTYFLFDLGHLSLDKIKDLVYGRTILNLKDKILEILQKASLYNSCLQIQLLMVVTIHNLQEQF